MADTKVTKEEAIQLFNVVETSLSEFPPPEQSWINGVFVMCVSHDRVQNEFGEFYYEAYVLMIPGTPYFRGIMLSGANRLDVEQQLVIGTAEEI